MRRGGETADVGLEWTFARREALQYKVAKLGARYMALVLKVIFGETEFRPGDEFTVDFERLEPSKCVALEELIRRQALEAEAERKAAKAAKAAAAEAAKDAEAAKQAVKGAKEAEAAMEAIKGAKEAEAAKEAIKGAKEAEAAKEAIKMAKDAEAAKVAVMEGKLAEAAKKAAEGTEVAKEASGVSFAPAPAPIKAIIKRPPKSIPRAPAPVPAQETKAEPPASDTVEESPPERKESPSLPQGRSRSAKSPIKSSSPDPVVLTKVEMPRLGELPCRLEVKLASDENYHSCSILAMRGARYLALYDDELSLQWIEISGPRSVTWRSAVIRDEPRVARKVSATMCDEVLSWLCALDAAEIVLRFESDSMTLAKCCERLERRVVKSGIDFAKDVRAVHSSIVMHALERGMPNSWRHPSKRRRQEGDEDLEELVHAAQVLAAAFEHKWANVLSTQYLKKDDDSWRRPYCKPRNRPLDDVDLVGHTVELYWDGDNAWYRGKVRSTSRKTGKARLDYEDGTVETVELSCNAIRVVQYPPEHHEPQDSERSNDNSDRRRPVYFPPLPHHTNHQDEDTAAGVEDSKQPACSKQPHSPNAKKRRRATPLEDPDVAALLPFLSKQPPRRCREQREQLIRPPESDPTKEGRQERPSSSRRRRRSEDDRHRDDEARQASEAESYNFSCHKLGKLVWAKSGSHPWWPAELCLLVLDELVEAFPSTGAPWSKGYRKCMVLYFNNGEAEFDLLSPHTFVVPFSSDKPSVPSRFAFAACLRLLCFAGAHELVPPSGVAS